MIAQRAKFEMVVGEFK